MAEFKLVTVYEAMGMLTAQVIKSKLEFAGIPVMLKYESAGQVIGLTVDGLGMVKVQVPEEWVTDAGSLITEAPPDAPDEGDDLEVAETDAE